LKQHADCIIPGHNQRHYDFRKGRRLNKKDHIVQWPKPRKPNGMSQKDYAKYPSFISIREFKVGGTIYITTLLEEKKYPKKELAALYQRRWEAEINLNALKTVLGMDKLVCKSPDMIKKEIGFFFLAYNIIRYIIANAAVQHDVLPSTISFKGTLQLLNELMPYLSMCSTKRKWLALYNQLLSLIVTKKVGNRPGRFEPRAIRLQPKSFPILRTSRKSEKFKLQKKLTKKMKQLKKEALTA
jgi:hypothetical protein